MIERPGLTVRKASVGPMDNDAYLLTCTATGEQLLVDAAAEPERLLALVREGSGRLGTVVTTHAHHDHVGALAEVVAATGASTAAGAEDAPEIAVATDRLLGQGDVIVLGVQRLEVIALRGHTPGSVALLWEADRSGAALEGAAAVDVAPLLFTGDSLFPGGVGKTDRDPVRFARLLADVEERVFSRLPDATEVHPGHGDATTLGAERPALGAWRERGW
ncbi:MBL fold metallo-hydrolase [Brachybacterium sp. DNPG3]